MLSLGSLLALNASVHGSNAGRGLDDKRWLLAPLALWGSGMTENDEENVSSLKYPK